MLPAGRDRTPASLRADASRNDAGRHAPSADVPKLNKQVLFHFIFILHSKSLDILVLPLFCIKISGNAKLFLHLPFMIVIQRGIFLVQRDIDFYLYRDPEKNPNPLSLLQNNEKIRNRQVKLREVLLV